MLAFHAMVLEIVLGVVQIGFIVWGLLVSIKPIAPEQRKWHIGGVIGLGLFGVLLTALIAYRGSKAQESAALAQQNMQRELDSTRSELRASRLSQEYMKGQLSSLSVLAMHSSANSGQSNSELAAHLSQMSSGLQMSDWNNAQLRDRANDLSKRMRHFEARYDEIEEGIVQDYGFVSYGEGSKRQAKQDAEEKAAIDKLDKQETTEFRAIFMDEANSMRLELLRRLHKPDLPSRQPEAFIGQIDDPNAISNAAGYLEMLAKQLPR